MGFAVEVEANGGGVRASRADDGEGFGGFGAGDEEAGRGEGAGDVDDFAGEGGELVGVVGGSRGAGEGCDLVGCWVPVCCHCERCEGLIRICERCVM